VFAPKEVGGHLIETPFGGEAFLKGQLVPQNKESRVAKTKGFAMRENVWVPQ